MNNRNNNDNDKIKKNSGFKDKVNKLFGGINMSWTRVLLGAVILGVYTGLVMMITILKDTSFQDIGVSFEWWVLFAVILVVNCNKGYEAMLKCFIFFLISQPIVYMVQILFGHMDFEEAYRYYIYWFKWTILTLPGGFIAYFCKKQNVAGAVILGLGNTIQLIMAKTYIGMCQEAFPHHLLTIIFSIISIVVMTICIQKKKINRIIAFVLPVVVLIILILYCKANGLYI